MARKAKTRKYKLTNQGDGEPGPFADDTVLSKVRRIECINWYNENGDNKKFKTWTLSYLKSVKIDALDLNDVSPTWFSSAVGGLCRMASRGYTLTEDQKQWILKRVKTYPIPEKTPLQKTLVEKKLDLAEIKEDKIFSLIETALDSSDPEFSLYNTLKIENAPQALAKKILSKYTSLMSEYDELIDKKSADLVEAYSFIGLRERKRLRLYLQNILNDIEKYIGAKKVVVRKPRAKKPVPVEKVVSRYKYKKEDNVYKLKSVHPSSVVGAKYALTFNTKYRYFTLFVSKDEKGFEVKGNSIYGYDEEKSIRKGTRNPEQVLLDLLKTTKAKTIKVMETLSSNPKGLNGRGSDDAVILKVFN